MALRIPCHRLTLTPGGLLHSYFGATGFRRPVIDAFLVGPAGRVIRGPVHVDSGSDFTLFAVGVATSLGLALPQPRQVAFSGAGGTYTATASFPPDGTVSLFVTDYREYCYLPTPLVGFHAPGHGAAGQRSVLGLAGFLRHFRTTLEFAPAVVELDPAAAFAGTHGMLPLDRGLLGFIASLRGAG